MLLRLGRADAGVLLEVIDSGPGIAAEEVEKVLMPFYRAQSTLDVNPGGTGLGLAIVRDIANVHGATWRSPKVKAARAGAG